MRGLPGWRRECCLKLRARSTSSVTLTGICFEPTSHGILVSTMQDPQQLISRAYQQARRSGKPDWHRMTTAVLKNRLLEITSREFNEARYDASNFMEFVSRYPELLSVDDSEFPPVVTLRGSEADRLLSTDADDQSTFYRIRSDLWQAALDYSSGTKYVWDVEAGESRPIRGSETGPTIDTIDADIQRRWRREFMEERSESFDLTDTEMKQADEWTNLQLGTSRLPDRLVRPWNQYFRDCVLGHLRGWFSKNGLDEPQDLVSTSGQRQTSRSTATEELRELVISAARQMTHEELSGLRLPIEAVLHITKRRKR